MSVDRAGVGDPSARFRVYIGNRPDFAGLATLSNIRPLQNGEIEQISRACGNGWRKVFNVYAKLIYALPGVPNRTQPNWQSFRDNCLLQTGCGLSLLFSPPEFGLANTFHLVMGKHYGLSLGLPEELEWLDSEFAIVRKHNLVLCPYFDYRQLSNAKIIRLVELIQRHSMLR